MLFNAAGIIQVLQEAVALTPTAAVLLTLSLGRLTVSTQPEQFVVEMIRSFAIESVVDVVVRLCPDGVVAWTTSMLDTPLLRQDPAEPRVNSSMSRREIHISSSRRSNRPMPRRCSWTPSSPQPRRS